jgi:hypothetical protein
LDQNFELSVIKRCWEDQLRLKGRSKNKIKSYFKYSFNYTGKDFVSDCDLYMACLIFKKQREYIDGKKENIVIPNLRMKYIREFNDEESKLLR